MIIETLKAMRNESAGSDLANNPFAAANHAVHSTFGTVFPAGIHLRHYKGGTYRVSGWHLRESDLAVYVTYNEIKRDGTLSSITWSRPLHEFMEHGPGLVDHEGRQVRRFTRKD
jgi:hypothetical protein